MKRSDAQRIAKYLAKTVPTTVSLKVAAMLESMKSGFSPVTEDLVNMLLLVQTELAGITVGTPPAPIPTIYYGQYMAYAEELWKLLRTTSQPAVNGLAQAVKAKWASRGLESTALVTIAAHVFNITVT